MNITQNLVDMVKFQIPREILQEAFMPRRYDPARREFFRDNQLGVSLDAEIERQIIEGRVMVDTNLCSGVETTLRLSGEPFEQIDPYNMIYRIGEHLTQNRTITAVYNVSYGEGYHLGGRANLYCGSSPLSDVASGMLSAQTPMPPISTAKVSLVAHNTILVSDSGAVPMVAYLRCQLTHEPHFANIKPCHVHTLQELVLLATKAYIYNTLVIYLDEGALRYGSQLGRMREIVDSYADAAQMYKEYLQSDWRQVATINDTEKWRRIMAWTVGGRR